MGEVNESDSRRKLKEGSKLLEFVQQLEFLDVSKLKEKIEEKVQDQIILQYAYIVHDKDKKEGSTDELVKPHIHLLMKFRYRVTLASVKGWFRGYCELQNLQRVRKTWISACRYLTHKNSPDKFQYDDSLVVANFDYIATCDISHRLKPEKPRGRRKRELDDDLLEYLDGIADGRITEKNVGTTVPQRIYVRFAKEIRDAFTHYRKRLEALVRNAPSRSLVGFYIWGNSGVGKSTLSRQICRQLVDDDVFLSSSHNDSLDGYDGEMAIILDDMRGNDVDISTIMKLTDPHHYSRGKSRFRNKPIFARLIVITSTQAPREYFKTLLKNQSEDYVQFLRRFKTMFHLLPDIMEVYFFNTGTKDLELLESVDNPFAFIDQEEREVEESKQQAIMLKNLALSCKPDRSAPLPSILKKCLKNTDEDSCSVNDPK